MNRDGRFTVSDVGLWITYFLFLPGDYFIGFAINSLPDFTEFFEISFNRCHGTLSDVFGLLIWGFCCLIGLGVGSRLQEAWTLIKNKPA
jgi:hypothetical protein